MRTEAAKKLAKAQGCSLVYLQDGGPGMWFLTISTENPAWRPAGDKDPVWSSGELYDMTPETLQKECLGLFS